MNKKILVLSAASVLAGTCAMLHHGGGAEAVANLEPTKGNEARGSVTFAQHGDRVHVMAKVSGLKPNGEHGFHIHEKGDCSSGDGMSTGGHYNPFSKPHGPQAGPHHGGYMPSLNADASGNATASFDLGDVSIGSGAGDIVGKGLIVHRDADDFTTQ